MSAVPVHALFAFQQSPVVQEHRRTEEKTYFSEVLARGEAAKKDKESRTLISEMQQILKSHVSAHWRGQSAESQPLDHKITDCIEVPNVQLREFAFLAKG